MAAMSWYIAALMTVSIGAIIPYSSAPRSITRVSDTFGSNMMALGVTNRTPLTTPWGQRNRTWWHWGWPTGRHSLHSDDRQINLNLFCISITLNFVPWQLCCKVINNMAIRDDRPSVATTHIWRHNVSMISSHNTQLTLWYTLMAYFVLSPNGEESLVK